MLGIALNPAEDEDDGHGDARRGGRARERRLRVARPARELVVERLRRRLGGAVAIKCRDHETGIPAQCHPPELTTMPNARAMQDESTTESTRNALRHAQVPAAVRGGS